MLVEFEFLTTDYGVSCLGRLKFPFMYNNYMPMLIITVDGNGYQDRYKWSNEFDTGHE